MTKGMFAITCANAALFSTNGNRVGVRLASLVREPVLIIGVWKNPKKNDGDGHRYCDMYHALTSRGLGWLNDEEVKLLFELGRMVP
jgi:hypothetical protein